MKTLKITYWSTTILFSALFLMSGIMYLINYGMVAETFQRLGFPTFIIYPLAIAKILGAIVLLTPRKFLMKDWAYSAFLFNILLAIGAHLNAKDSEFIPAIVASILLLISYITYHRITLKPIYS